MALLALWTTAKTTFQSATHKKKPTDKFLAVFRLGTGLESTLKDADSAKTAGDMKKALLKFSAAADDYIRKLDSIAKDPAAVAAVDKAGYVAAIQKLKTDLQKIVQEGNKVAAALESVAAKEKVSSPEAIKAATDAVEEREAALQLARDLAPQFRNAMAEVTKNAQLAAKHLETARQAGKSGDKHGALVAVGVIEKYVDEIEKTTAQIGQLYAQRVNSGPILSARVDPSTKLNALQDPMKRQLTDRSNAAFRELGKVTAEITALLGNIKGKVIEVKTTSAQAQAASDVAKDPKEYIKQLSELRDTLKKLMTDIRLKGDRVLKGQAAVADQLKQEKEVQLNWYRNQEGQWQRYEPEFQSALKTLAQISAQAQAIPRGALEDSAISSLMHAVVQETQSEVGYVRRVGGAGMNLMATIQKQRSALAK